MKRRFFILFVIAVLAGVLFAGRALASEPSNDDGTGYSSAPEITEFC